MKNCNCDKQKIDMAVCGPSGTVLPSETRYITKVIQPSVIKCGNIMLEPWMMSVERTKYVIKWNFDLDGKTITVPEKCVLEFDGGSLKNGTIIGQDTFINNVGGVADIFGLGTDKQGTWREVGDGSVKPGDLANYYTKSELDSGEGKRPTTTEVEEMIGEIESGKDKEYNPAEFSGLGKVYLKKNIVEVGGVEKNILTQSAFYKDGTQTPNTDTVFVVQYDFDLNGQTINVPANCVLEFDGGNFNNGILVGNNTCINTAAVSIFGNNLIADGSFTNSTVYPEWFGAKGDGVTDDTSSMRSAMKFAAGRRIVLSQRYAIYWYVTIYSNTDVLIDGECLFRRNGDDRSELEEAWPGGCFELYDRTKTPLGYNGIHDVYVHGCGTVDSGVVDNDGGAEFPKGSKISAFRVHHNKNVRIEGLTFRRYARHCMEIGASDIVTISRCWFKGTQMEPNDESDTIQIECSAEGGCDGATAYDNIPTRRLTVEDCIFKPETGFWLTVCVGSHSNAAGGVPYDASSEDYWYKDITIKRCYFEYSSNFDDIGSAQKVPVLRINGLTDGWYITDNTFIVGATPISTSVKYTYRANKNILVQNNYMRVTNKSVLSFIECQQFDISNNFIVLQTQNEEDTVFHFWRPCSGVIRNNTISLLPTNNGSTGKIFHVPTDSQNNCSISIYNNVIKGFRNMSDAQQENYITQLKRFALPNDTEIGENFSTVHIGGAASTSNAIKISRPLPISGDNRDCMMGIEYTAYDITGLTYVLDISISWWNTIGCVVTRNPESMNMVRVYKSETDDCIYIQNVDSNISRVFVTTTKTTMGIRGNMSLVNASELPADVVEVATGTYYDPSAAQETSNPNLASYLLPLQSTDNTTFAKATFANILKKACVLAEDNFVRVTTGSLNDVTSTCLFLVATNDINSVNDLPERVACRGISIRIGGTYGDTLQIVLTYTGNLYYRYNWWNESWRNWKQLAVVSEPELEPTPSDNENT